MNRHGFRKIIMSIVITCYSVSLCAASPDRGIADSRRFCLKALPCAQLPVEVRTHDIFRAIHGVVERMKEGNTSPEKVDAFLAESVEILNTFVTLTFPDETIHFFIDQETKNIVFKKDLVISAMQTDDEKKNDFTKQSLLPIGTNLAQLTAPDTDPAFRMKIFDAIRPQFEDNPSVFDAPELVFNAILSCATYIPYKDVYEAETEVPRLLIKIGKKIPYINRILEKIKKKNQTKDHFANSLPKLREKAIDCLINILKEGKLSYKNSELGFYLAIMEKDEPNTKIQGKIKKANDWIMYNQDIFNKPTRIDIENVGPDVETVLITGGAGFLGSHLCEFMLEKGYQVICVDNFVSGQRRNISHLMNNPRFSLVVHDMTMPLTVDTSLDYVVHLAALASPKFYKRLPDLTRQVTVQGTENAIEIARKNKARFLFSSTSEVYGDPKVSPQPETYIGSINPVGDRSCYDIAKQLAETTIRTAIEKKQVDARIVRIFNTYGPRLRDDDGRVMIEFIKRALLGNPLIAFGTGSQTRSFCYVNDLINGIYQVLTYDDFLPLDRKLIETQEQRYNFFILFIRHIVDSFIKVLPRPLNDYADKIFNKLINKLPVYKKRYIDKCMHERIFNIGNPNEEITMKWLADLIIGLTKSKSTIDYKTALQDDPRKRRPDITKAKKILQWEPLIPLEIGVAKTILWYIREHVFKEDIPNFSGSYAAYAHQRDVLTLGDAPVYATEKEGAIPDELIEPTKKIFPQSEKDILLTKLFSKTAQDTICPADHPIQILLDEQQVRIEYKLYENLSSHQYIACERQGDVIVMHVDYELLNNHIICKALCIGALVKALLARPEEENVQMTQAKEMFSAWITLKTLDAELSRVTMKEKNEKAIMDMLLFLGVKGHESLRGQHFYNQYTAYRKCNGNQDREYEIIKKFFRIKGGAHTLLINDWEKLCKPLIMYLKDPIKQKSESIMKEETNTFIEAARTALISSRKRAIILTEITHISKNVVEVIRRYPQIKLYLNVDADVPVPDYAAQIDNIEILREQELNTVLNQALIWVEGNMQQVSIVGEDTEMIASLLSRGIKHAQLFALFDSDQRENEEQKHIYQGKALDIVILAACLSPAQLKKMIGPHKLFVSPGLIKVVNLDFIEKIAFSEGDSLSNIFISLSSRVFDALKKQETQALIKKAA